MAVSFELEEEVTNITLQYKFEKDQIKTENARALNILGQTDRMTDAGISISHTQCCGGGQKSS